MDAGQLAMIAGVVLSLGFSYIPGLNVAFDALESVHKQLIMAGLLLVVALGVFGLSCASFISSVTCDRAGMVGLATVFIQALVANQGVYRLSPKPVALRKS